MLLRCCWTCWNLGWILNKLWMHQEFMYTMSKKVRPALQHTHAHTHYRVTCRKQHLSIFTCWSPTANNDNTIALFSIEIHRFHYSFTPQSDTGGRKLPLQSQLPRADWPRYRTMLLEIWLYAWTFLCPADQWVVNLEGGVNQEVAEELRKRGHKVNWPVTGTL